MATPGELSAATVRFSFSTASNKDLELYPNSSWQRLLFQGGGLEPVTERSAVVFTTTPWNNTGGYVRWPVSGEDGLTYRLLTSITADGNYIVEAYLNSHLGNNDPADYGFHYIHARMTASSNKLHATVNRYQIAAGPTQTRLEKVIGGNITVLATHARIEDSSIMRLIVNEDQISMEEMHDSSQGFFLGKGGPILWTESVIDSDIQWQSPTANDGKYVGITPTGRYGYIDNFMVIPILRIRTVFDTIDMDISEASEAAAVIKFQTAADDIDVGISGSSSKDVTATKTAADTLSLDVAESTPIVIRTYQLTIRAGLLTDVVAGKVITQWGADQAIIPGVPGSALILGSIPDYVYDGSVGEYVVSVSSIAETDFESLIAIHMGMMYPPNGVRGSLQSYIHASWEDGKRPYFRAAVVTPQAIYPLTQDPAFLDIILSGGYRRLPTGVTSWPPNIAASEKMRAGQVTHVQGDTTQNLLEMTLFDIQAISEPAELDATNNDIKLRGLEVLPVNDGYFAIEAVKESHQSAIQQGEALVMDGINNPPGGYIIRRAADDGAENVNMSPLVPIHGSHLELLPNKENVITLLVDQWSDVDAAGAYTDTVEFNAWIDYEPRFIYV